MLTWRINCTTAKQMNQGEVICTTTLFVFNEPLLSAAVVKNNKCLVLWILWSACWSAGALLTSWWTVSLVFGDVVNPSRAGGEFSRTRGPSLLPSWRRRAPHQMFICLRGTFGEKGDWVSGEAAGQRGRRAESRACYVLARSLCFHCHRLSSTSSAPSSDVFLSARYDDSTSVDFSHCRPLFPGLFALPLFVSFAGGLTESCSLTFPSYGPCYRCLNPHKSLLSWAWCQPGSPLFCRSLGGFWFRADWFCHFFG